MGNFYTHNLFAVCRQVHKHFSHLLHKTNFRWEYPKKCSVLIYDGIMSASFEQLLLRAKIEFQILDIRLNCISVPVGLRALIQTIFRGGNLMFNYICTYIGMTNCRWILTNRDLDPMFWKLSSLFPEKRTAFIQHGWRGNGAPKDVNPGLVSLVDVAFLMSKHAVPTYRPYVELKEIHLVGSIKNNSVRPSKILRTSANKNEVAYVSDFLGIQNWDSAIKHNFEILQDWIESRALSLLILPRHLEGSPEFRDEEDFYGQFPNCTLLKKRQHEENLLVADAMSLVVVNSSTMAYEVISRKTVPVAIINSVSQLAGFIQCKFGIPSFTPPEGTFHTHTSTKERIFHVLDAAFDRPEECITTLDALSLMPYDSNNTILADFLTKIEQPF